MVEAVKVDLGFALMFCATHDVNRRDKFGVGISDPKHSCPCLELCPCRDNNAERPCRIVRTYLKLHWGIDS